MVTCKKIIILLSFIIAESYKGMRYVDLYFYIYLFGLKIVCVLEKA